MKCPRWRRRLVENLSCNRNMFKSLFKSSEQKNAEAKAKAAALNAKRRAQGLVPYTYTVRRQGEQTHIQESDMIPENVTEWVTEEEKARRIKESANLLAKQQKNREEFDAYMARTRAEAALAEAKRKETRKQEQIVWCRQLIAEEDNAELPQSAGKRSKTKKDRKRTRQTRNRRQTLF